MPQDALDALVQQTVRQTETAGGAAPAPKAQASPLDALVQSTAKRTLDSAPAGWPDTALQNAAVRERGGQLPRYEQLRRQPWFSKVDAEFKKAGISTYAWVKNALRESGGDPGAEGDRSKGGTATSFGLFQLHHGGMLDVLTKRTGGDLNAAIALAKNPVEAAKVMAQEWKRQGLGNIKDERAQAYAFTRYLEKPAEEIARQVAAQLGQEHVPYRVHPKSPAYAGQPTTKPRTANVAAAGKMVQKQQAAARLDALVGHRTFDAINWDVAKPHPWGAGEQALAIFDENLRRAKYGMARETVVEKTLNGEFPVFVLAADPKQRQYQVSALRALKWPVEDLYAELVKQFPGTRPPPPGWAAAGAGGGTAMMLPSPEDVAGFKASVTPKALQAVIEERQGRALTNFQKAALPLISATLQTRYEDNLQGSQRVNTAAFAKGAEVVAGAFGGLGALAKAAPLTRGAAASAGAKAALSRGALGSAAASGAAYEAASGLGQGDTPAEIASRTAMGAVGGVAGQAVLGVPLGAAAGALGFTPPKPKPKALSGVSQKALPPGPGPRIDTMPPPYSALEPGGGQKALPGPRPRSPSEVRVGEGGASGRVVVTGQRTPAKGVAATRNPGTEVGVGDPVWIVRGGRYPAMAAQVREVTQDGTLRLGARDGEGPVFGREFTPDRVYADWEEIAKARPAQTPAQPTLRPAKAPSTEPQQTPAQKPTAAPAPSKPPVTVIDPNVKVDTAAAVARNVFARAKVGGQHKRSTLGGTSVSEQPGEFVLLDVRDPIVSHDINGVKDPDYPQTLQGRRRDDVDPRRQVHDIVAKWDPDELWDTNSVQSGMPSISEEGLVEVGNGRTLALRDVYDRDPGGLGYRDRLRENAARFGFTADDVDALERPVVMWRRKSKMSPSERVQWTDEANVPTTAGYKKGEQSSTDARRLATLLNSSEGNALERALATQEGSLPNDDVVSAWEEKLVPTSQRGSLRAAGGRKYLDETRERLSNALVKMVFGESAFSDALAEGEESGVAALVRAVRGNVALLARLKVAAAKAGDDGKAYGDVFLEALRDAAAEFKAAKNSGRKPTSNAQMVADIFLEDDPDPGAVRLAMRNALLDLFISRKTSDIADPIREYASKALAILKEGEGGQAGLFDAADVAKPKAHRLWERVTNKTVAAANVIDTSGATRGLVLDSAGQPKTFYHGTPSSFVEFDEGMLGANTGAASAKRGFFFTDNPEVAKSYAWKPAGVFSGESRAALADLPEETLWALYEASGLGRRSDDPDKPIAEVVGGLVNVIWNGVSERDLNYLAAFRKVLGAESAEKFSPEQRVVRSNLVITNPLVVDAAGDSASDMMDAAVAKAIRGRHDALIVKNVHDSVLGPDDKSGGTRSTVYVVFSKRQIYNDTSGTPAPRARATAPASGGEGGALIDSGSMTDEQAIQNIVTLRSKTSGPQSAEQVAAAATQLGISENRVPAVLTKLERAGKIVKDGDGWRGGTLPPQSGGKPGTLTMAGQGPKQAELPRAAPSPEAQVRLEQELVRGTTIGEGLDQMEAAWKATDYSKITDEMKRKGSENLRRDALAQLQGFRDAMERGSLTEGQHADLVELWGKHRAKLRTAKSRDAKKAVKPDVVTTRPVAEDPDTLFQSGGGGSIPRRRRWFGSPTPAGARAVSIGPGQQPLPGQAGVKGGPREQFLNAMGRAMKMRPEQQEAYEAVMDAYTAAWGRMTGKKPDEWYTSRIDSVAVGRADVNTKGSDVIMGRNRGSIKFTDTGKAIISALQNPNVTTAVHEVAHVWRRDLYRALDEATDPKILSDLKADLEVLERAYAVSLDKSTGSPRWTRFQEERFAADAERYFRDGLAPQGADARLKTAFRKLKEWFSSIYRRLTGSPVERDLSPDVRELFDQMFVGPGYAIQMRALREQQAAQARMVLPPALRGKASRASQGGQFWEVTIPREQMDGWAKKHPEVRLIGPMENSPTDKTVRLMFQLKPAAKPAAALPTKGAVQAGIDRLILPKGMVPPSDLPEHEYVRWLKSGAAAFETFAESAGHYGKLFADGMRKINTLSNHHGAQNADDVRSLFIGKKKDFIRAVVRYDRRRELLALPQNKGKTMADIMPDAPADVVATADELRAVMDNYLLTEAQALGVEREGRTLKGGGSSLPRMWSKKGREFLEDLAASVTPDDELKPTPRVKAVLDGMVAAGHYADASTAEKALLKYQQAQSGKMSLPDPEYFSKERHLRGLPDELFDDDVLEWLEHSLYRLHRYLEARREWGKNIEAAGALIDAMPIDSNAKAYMKRVVGAIYSGKQEMSPVGKKVAGAIQSAEVIGKLSGVVFPISNLVQGIAGNTDWGAMNAFRASWIALQRHRAPQNQPEILRAVRRSGAVSDVFGDIGDAGPAARFLAKMSAWTEEQNFYTSALAVGLQMDRDLGLLRDFETAKLSPDGKKLQRILRGLATLGGETETATRYRVEHVMKMTPEEMAASIATGDITPLQAARAMQAMVQDRQFRKTLTQQPALSQTAPAFRVLFQFRPFEIRQALHLLNLAKRAVGIGEVRPLVQAVIAMGIGGAIAQYAWSYAAGRGGSGTVINEVKESVKEDEWDESYLKDRIKHAFMMGGSPGMQLWAMDDKNADTLMLDTTLGVAGSSAKNLTRWGSTWARRPENFWEATQELVGRELRVGREVARMTTWVANRDTDIRPELQELKDRVRLSEPKTFIESFNPDAPLLRQMAGFLESGNLEHAITVARKYQRLNPEKDARAALRSSMMARGPRGGVTEEKWRNLLDTMPGRTRALADAIDQQWIARVNAVVGGL